LRDKVANLKNFDIAIKAAMWHHFGHFHPGIAETVRYTKQQNIKFARQIFDHLLAENCSEVRGYYITLEFLYEYLNDVTM
jgi:hypothetical protein